jgi:CBS domain-containing protein
MTEADKTPRSRMRCSEIMTRKLHTAAPETPLRDIARMMRDGDMGTVPVVAGSKLVGIVTDRDIVVRGVADEHDHLTPASHGELKGIIAMADVALETEDEREIAETLEEISSGSSFWSKS